MCQILFNCDLMCYSDEYWTFRSIQVVYKTVGSPKSCKIILNVLNECLQLFLLEKWNLDMKFESSKCVAFILKFANLFLLYQ
jgi:hypothetical protein